MLCVIAMKGYSILPICPEVEPYHQIQFSLIPRALFWRVLLLSRKCFPRLLSLTDWSVWVNIFSKRALLLGTTTGWDEGKFWIHYTYEHVMDQPGWVTFITPCVLHISFIYVYMRALWVVLQTRLANLDEWVRVSFGATFVRPCVPIYIYI